MSLSSGSSALRPAACRLSRLCPSLCLCSLSVRLCRCRCRFSRPSLARRPGVLAVQDLASFARATRVRFAPFPSSALASAPLARRHASLVFLRIFFVCSSGSVAARLLFHFSLAGVHSLRPSHCCCSSSSSPRGGRPLSILVWSRGSLVVLRHRAMHGARTNRFRRRRVVSRSHRARACVRWALQTGASCAVPGRGNPQLGPRRDVSQLRASLSLFGVFSWSGRVVCALAGACVGVMRSVSLANLSVKSVLACCFPSPSRPALLWEKRLHEAVGSGSASSVASVRAFLRLIVTCNSRCTRLRMRTRRYRSVRV